MSTHPNEPDPDVEREKLMSFLERRLVGTGPQWGVQTVSGDVIWKRRDVPLDRADAELMLTQRGMPGERLVVREVTSWEDVGRTGSWVQSAKDAIFARLHRGDNPACDCGETAH